MLHSAEVVRRKRLMSPNRSNAITILLTLSFFCGCSRPPADNASNSDPQKLPFDRQPPASGISPSQSLIPSTTKLPEGTPIHDAPKEDPGRSMDKAEYIQWLKRKGLKVTENSDGSFRVSKDDRN